MRPPFRIRSCTTEPATNPSLQYASSQNPSKAAAPAEAHGSPVRTPRPLEQKVRRAPTWDVGMNEGWGMFRWGVDQHRSDTVGAGHLQNLVSGQEELEKQEAGSAAVTPRTAPEGSSPGAWGQEPNCLLTPPALPVTGHHKDGAQGGQLWLMERSL